MKTALCIIILLLMITSLIIEYIYCDLQITILILWVCLLLTQIKNHLKD
jgi:hypothetical protein